MKTKVIFFLGTIVVGLLFAVLAPSNMKDKFVGIATFSTNERRCFNFHKEHFVDPDSAYVVSSYVWTRENELSKGLEYEYHDPAFDKYEAMLNVSVMAKNSMGGYVREYVSCPLINNKFDSHEAFMHKAADSVGYIAAEEAPIVSEEVLEVIEEIPAEPRVAE